MIKVEEKWTNGLKTVKIYILGILAYKRTRIDTSVKIDFKKSVVTEIGIIQAVITFVKILFQSKIILVRPRFIKSIWKCPYVYCIGKEQYTDECGNPSERMYILIKGVNGRVYADSWLLRIGGVWTCSRVNRIDRYELGSEGD